VSPLNARFIGALYLAAALGLIVATAVRQVVEARIMLIGFGLVSVLVLGVTALYWGDFTAKRLPVLWLVTYSIDPIVVGATLVALRLWRPAASGRHRLSALLFAELIVLGLVGLILLAAPELAVSFWPWKITPLLARTYGAFFATFAVGAGIATGESHRAALLPVVVSSFGLMVFVLVASSLHLDRFTPGLPTVVWFGSLGIGAVAFGIALAGLLSGSMAPSPSRAIRLGPRPTE
jgi:hypothetical protein